MIHQVAAAASFIVSIEKFLLLAFETKNKKEEKFT
jgi:hypothetical protein